MRDHQVSADVISVEKLLHKESMVVHMKRDCDTLWCDRRLSANYRAWHGPHPAVDMPTVR